VTVPTGLSVSGSPVTSSGTIAISLASGYSIPTTSSQTNWDTAYTDRLKWDGGSTGLAAATGRTSLGLGTIATQNANNVSITGGSITGITDLAVADGGTGASSFTANNVLLGNGTSAFQTVAPGASGNILTSNGTTWQSSAPSSGGVTSVSAGNGIAVSGTTAVTVSLDFYTGSSSTNTSYPIGSYVCASSNSCCVQPLVNASSTIYLGPSCNRRFHMLTTTYSSTSLSGTWRSRGKSQVASGSVFLMQRVA